MANDNREQVSALIDDELSPQDIDRTLRLLSEDDQHREAWARYHLIGDVIRGEHVFDPAGDIADRIRAQLESEPAIIATPRRDKQDSGKSRQARAHWLKPAVGLAAVASVVALTLFSLPDVREQTSPGNLRVASAPPTVIYQTGTGMRWKNLSEPGVESKLNQYLVDHSEYASPGGISGVLPYATFVSYDSGR